MPDNSALPVPTETTSDPHGQAAMLLVESLLYVLVDNEALSLSEAAEAVEIARDAQFALADAGRSPTEATDLLEKLLHSLESDLRVDLAAGGRTVPGTTP